MDPTRREAIAAGIVFGLSMTAAGAQNPAKSSPKAGEESAAALRELLAANRKNHPIYRGGLANHLSMELFALAALGATPDRLREFSAAYSKHLEPFPAGGSTVAAADWTAAIGQPEKLHGLVEYFHEDLRDRGREAGLRDALGHLMPALSSELYHCLIRTAYGVQFGDDEEIAHGLGYWAIRGQTLGTLSKTPANTTGMAELLARVRAAPELAQAKLDSGSNPARMQRASQLPGFAELVDSFRADERALDDLARSAVELYLSTHDFIALHVVTATHALRIVLPYCPDPELALRHHAQAFAAAYIRMGAPPIAASFSTPAPEWPATVQAAVASADDHDAKFTWSCRDESAVRGGELYALAAAQRVQRA